MSNANAVSSISSNIDAYIFVTLNSVKNDAVYLLFNVQPITFVTYKAIISLILIIILKLCL